MSIAHSISSLDFGFIFGLRNEHYLTLPEKYHPPLRLNLMRKETKREIEKNFVLHSMRQTEKSRICLFYIP